MTPTPKPRRARARALRAACAALLGAAAAVLVACGSSSGGLMSPSQAGPLASDIAAVEAAAQRGNGDCTATEAALLKTDQDFAALPASVNSGLRDTLRTGIENLHKVAREACLQPLVQTTTTTTPKTATTPTTTTPTTTQRTTPTTGTSTTPPPVKTPEAGEESGVGGGTLAPGEGAGKPSGGAGGSGAEEGGSGAGGNGAGGQEGGK